MAFDPARVKSLFLEASDLLLSEERIAYLDRACTGEPDLRARVEALLAIQDSDGPVSVLQASGARDFSRSETLDMPKMSESRTQQEPNISVPDVDLPTVGVTDIEPDVGTLADIRPSSHSDRFVPGEVIAGRYTLLEILGEGGMGSVFVAEQEKPIRRKVALKLIKPGMDTAQVVARFEAERQALAMMDHPSIARVLDVGATNAGRPFIVMELVDGVPITEYCDRHALTPKERLELFILVCRAIQHAHQKGIIHRDIKPSNVLVTRLEGVHLPKVIDFGVAKAIDQRLTDRTIFTAYGQMIGTPAYMSPEQAEIGVQDIDTRSDVFSLGVLLYELLTGTTPLESMVLRQAGYTEVQRLIREKEAPRPSSRLSLLGESATVVANCRGMEKKHLVRLLVNDLDWVAIKALEKDRNRRYDSPDALAGDIERFLHYEPIKARPPRLGRTLSKFVRRNRVAVGGAAIVTLTLGMAATLGAVLLMGKVREQGLELNLLREQQKREREDQVRGNLPDIRRAIDSGHPVRAFGLAREARKLLPGDATLAALWQELTDVGTLRVDPDGTTVFIRDWDAQVGDWLEIGVTPLVDVRIPRAPLRWKFEKAGLVSVERQNAFPAIAASTVKLLHKEEVPPGMELIPPSRMKDFPDIGFDLDSFAVDRYEVTNREFSRFLSAGGYKKSEYWQHKFVHQGKAISRDDALKLLVDQTGRPGPSSWSDGHYPVGEEEFPVRGVSWYEAAAYSAFVKKELPTAHHWQRVCTGDIRYLVPLSNFSGRGPARVGSYQGITARGLYDMAGNVKEWCFNEAGQGYLRILRGGAWDDPSHMFLFQEVEAPTSRKPTYGFRCVQYPQRPDDRAFAPLTQLGRIFDNELPPTPAELASHLTHFEYDATADLKIQCVSEDTHPEWSDIRHEVVSIEAAYGGERFDIHLFWPRSTPLPLEPVVWYPGNGAFELGSMDELLHNGDEAFFLGLARTGRLVCLPVYKGTLERRFKAGVVFELPPLQQRDAFVMATKDLRRTVDFLKTRKEINFRRLIFGGMSQGAYRGPVMLVAEPRFQAGLFFFGGYWRVALRPEMEPLNFTRAVKAPVLMINGSLDNIFPLEPNQRLFYKHLGSADKQQLLFENQGHVIPADIAIPAADRWLRKRWAAERL